LKKQITQPIIKPITPARSTFIRPAIVREKIATKQNETLEQVMNIVAPVKTPSKKLTTPRKKNNTPGPSKKKKKQPATVDDTHTADEPGHWEGPEWVPFPKLPVERPATVVAETSRNNANEESIPSKSASIRTDTGRVVTKKSVPSIRGMSMEMMDAAEFLLSRSKTGFTPSTGHQSYIGPNTIVASQATCVQPGFSSECSLLKNCITSL